MKPRGHKKAGSSIVEQAAILTAASLLARFLGFIYRVPLTGRIGDEGNGLYAISYNLYLFFFVLSAAGLPAAISKMVGERVALGRQKDAYNVFKVSLIIATVLGAVSMLILFFGAGFFSELVRSPRSYYSIMTLAPTVLIVAIMGVFRGYFLGIGNAVPNAASQIVDQAFNAVFSVVCAWLLMESTTGDKIALGAAGGTLGTGIGAAAGLVFLLYIFYMSYPAIKATINGDQNGGTERKTDIGKILLRTAFPIIIGTAVFSITNVIDMSMINERLINGAGLSLETATELYGRFSGKYVTLSALPTSISTAFASVAIPSIATSHILKNKLAVEQKANMLMRISMILSIPAAVGMGVLANPLLLLLFRGYPEGGSLLTLGATSIVFLSVTQITTGILQGIGKVKIPVFAAIAGALVKIPVNYVLLGIPGININGAVISTTVFYMVTSGVDWYFLRKYTGFRPDFVGIIAKPLAASAFMGVTVLAVYYTIYAFTGINALACPAAVVIGMVSYLAGLLAIGGITKEDASQISFLRGFAKYLK